MRISRLVIFCFAYPLLLASATPAQETTSEQQKIAALIAEIRQLRSEIEGLKAENARLKQMLATTRPASRPSTSPWETTPPTYTLGPTVSLAGYKYSAPAGWSAQTPKDSPMAMLYGTRDKSGLILVRVRPKGASPDEAQKAYSDSVIQMLRQDFAKGKTEVIAPPTLQKDARFYVKVAERVRVKGDKIATQVHLYRNIHKDMIELTAITTADSREEIEAIQKLADAVLLSFKPEK